MWRKFNFFNSNEFADNGKISNSLQEATIISMTNGNNQIVICDSTGLIHIFSKTWECISFLGHDGTIPFCEITKQNNFLVTIGLEDDDSIATLKVWNLSKLLPSCIKTDKISIKHPTCLSVSNSGQYMALGFNGGSLSLYIGDIGKDYSKQPKILSVATVSIKGISFNQKGKVIHMYVCYNTGILVYHIENQIIEKKIILDEFLTPNTTCYGILKGSGTVESTFMVGRDEAIYCYTTDGKGQCYAIDGRKVFIKSVRTYLIIVTNIEQSNNALPSKKNLMLNVLDVQNNFMVFSETFSNIIGICVEFGTCFIITEDKTVYRLDENNLENKLDLLFKKNLFDIAVKIAKKSEYDFEGLSKIFQQYGDHLYAKGDYKGAVKQYTETIGVIDPSYVIKRFLDPKHINYLINYLQEIHKRRQASTDHTSLLLNCFKRVNRSDEITEFLKTEESSDDIMFDLDHAIRVCRISSIDQALKLAKNHKKHNYVVSILIEEMKKFKEAIEYILTLSISESTLCMKLYGIILMENLPDETIQILKKLFNDNKENEETNSVNLLNLLHLFINSSNNSIIEFLEYLLSNSLGCKLFINNMLIEHYLKCWKENNENKNRLLEIFRYSSGFYDKSQALILCRFYEFWPGIMLLYEEENMHQLIIRYHLKERNYNNLINDQWQKKGYKNRWLQILSQLRKDNKAPPKLLKYVLQIISQEKLQSPLQVLRCLAIEDGHQLSSIRKYLMRVFSNENICSIDDEKLVEKYFEDSIYLKNHIKRLKEEPIEFRVTICNTCHQPLSQPAYYFFCQHSFHQDCFRGYSDNDKDCPVCITKKIIHLNTLQAQHESRDQHESFQNLLDRSSLDPFSIISDYLKRALFNKTVIIE